MNIGAKVVCRVKDRPAVGTLVEEHPHTMLIALDNGDVIKRHRQKHGVGEVVDTKPQVTTDRTHER